MEDLKKVINFCAIQGVWNIQYLGVLTNIQGYDLAHQNKNKINLDTCL